MFRMFRMFRRAIDAAQSGRAWARRKPEPDKSPSAAAIYDDNAADGQAALEPAAVRGYGPAILNDAPQRTLAMRSPLAAGLIVRPSPWPVRRPHADARD